jgi:hypothetical protein
VFVSSKNFMSIKNNVVAAVLLVALTGTLASCGGGADVKDKVADAGKGAMDAGKGAVEAGKDAGGKAVDATKGAVDASGKALTGAAATAALTPLVKEAKTPLVLANTDVKAGKMDKAKANFAKFEGIWKTVGPKIQPLAGDKYAAIDAGITKLSTAMGGTDAKAAGGALDGVIKAMDGLTAAKK